MTPLERRVARLSAQPGASAGFTATPRFPADRLSDDEMRIAICIFLGVPPPTARCSGDDDTDELGRAALSAKTGSARNNTHNAFRDVVGEFHREAGRTVHIEVNGLFGPYPNQPEGAIKKGENRRMDIVSATPATGARDMLDTTRLDCATPSRMRSPAIFQPLKSAETKKRIKYSSNGPPGFGYVTIAAGAQGEMGDEGIAHLQELALDRARMLSLDDVPPKQLVASVYRSYRRRIGIVLMRYQARQCMQSVTVDTDRVVARACAADFLRSLGTPPQAPPQPAAAPTPPAHHANRGRRRGSARSTRGRRRR